VTQHSLKLIDRRGLSPIFATVILVAIVVVFGSLAYYFSSNLTNNATNNIVSSSATSQQSIGERLAFENVIYNQSLATLKVYVLNCGISNNLQIDSLFLYNSSSSSHTLLTYSQSKPSTWVVHDLNTGKTVSSLNVGEEGYFTVSLSSVPNLKGTVCDVHITTKSGSAFDYEFAP
jgi:flagellin-like protein